MSGINIGEIGTPLRINVNEDISAATSVLIIAQPEVGIKKEFVATVPAVDITINGVTYLANQYAEYITTSETDLDYIGRWRMKLKPTISSTDIPQTDYVKFRVLP
jgi:hypothetical protein